MKLKKIFFICAFLTLSIANAKESRIDSSKAIFHVGENTIVCGLVSEVKRFNKGVYLNMGPAYPRQHISVLIWESDRNYFDTRFGGLHKTKGRILCARGMIESYKNSLQIKVSNPEFLRLMQ